jgi:hypothetical protein
MKKLIILASLFALAGCSTIADLKEAYLMKYDTNEYQQISDIRTSAYYGKAGCDSFEDSKKSASTISKKTYSFKNYVEHLPYNTRVISSSIELDKIAQGLNDHYQKNEKVSVIFCKLKFESIEKSAEMMQKNIGAKPK